VLKGRDNMQNYQKYIAIAKKAAYVIILLYIIISGYLLYQKYFSSHTAVKEMTEQQITNPSDVKKALDVSDSEAKEIVEKVETVKEPEVSYTVEAPTVESAAEKVTDQIKNEDSTIPKAATAKTDRTAVVADITKQKVDVYKINLRNNHKIKAGVSYIDNKAYADVGYQAGRVEVIGHYGGPNKDGVSVMYTLKEW
jgi:preprotein translocase subunit SecF